MHYKRYVSFKDQMKVLIVSVSGLAVMVFILWLIDRNKPDEVLLHKGITTCEVLGWTTGHTKGSLGYIDYKFSYHGKEYIGEDYAGGCNHQLLFGKRILVMFDTLDPHYSGMLISDEDFKYAQVPVPDSLKWILKLCNN